MSDIPTRPDSRTALDASVEKGKLVKCLGKWDVLAYLLCTLVGIDAYGAVATYGAQSFTWLIFLALFFFVPYALITAEVGSAFTDEGGPYVWMRLAFGRLFASVGTTFYWLSNAVWLGGSLVLTALAAYNTFFPEIPKGSPLVYVWCLAFVWFAVLAAVLSISVGRWVPAVGAVARVVLIPFFTLSVIVYGLRHGFHGFQPHDFAPTYPVFLGAVPLLVFDLAGFEVPNAAGEEMRNPQRDVIFGIARSAVGTILLYGVPMLAILLVLPAKQLTGLSGFMDALKLVLTVWGGHVDASGTAVLSGAGKLLGWIMGALAVMTLATSGATWIMGADRIEAIAALDGAGPRAFGRFSARFGTPTAVNLTSGALSTVFLVLALQLTSAGGQAKAFQVMLSLAVSVSTIAYLFIFPALVRLRYSRPNVHRPYRVPGGAAGIWACVVIVLIWTVFAIITEVWPGFGAGWFGTPAGAVDLKGFGRFHYEMLQLIPIAIIAAIGVMFYAVGRRSAQSDAA